MSIPQSLTFPYVDKSALDVGVSAGIGWAGPTALGSAVAAVTHAVWSRDKLVTISIARAISVAGLGNKRRLVDGSQAAD